MNVKKLKHGGLSLLMTALFLAAIILLNVFTGMLTQRFYLKADLTETNLYSLSSQAADLLSGMEDTVDFIVLSEESAWLADYRWVRIAEILQNYAAVSGGRIRVQYVNPDLNSFNGPAYGNSLSALKAEYSELENMTRNDIIVLSARRAVSVPAANLFSVSYDSYGNGTITGIRADQELVSALLYVLNEKVAKVALLEGHGEDAAEYLQFLFERSGYTCQTVNLALRDIPEDTVFVVSAAPKNDFLSGEIEKLENYLLKGGNAMIFYDFQTLSLPLLDEFLLQRGVSVETKVVCDDVYSFSQVNLIAAEILPGALASSAEAADIGMYVAMFNARSIRSEWAGGIRGNISTFPLIQAYSSAYAKDYSEGNLTTLERESGDETGILTLAYDIRQSTYDANNQMVHSHLIVSTIGLVDDQLLMSYGQNVYNIMLIVGVASDLNPFGESVYIPSKNVSGEQLAVTVGQSRAVLILMVITLPLLIMLTGILVWRKRRHQ